MSFLFGHSSFVSTVFVIVLIEPKAREVDGSPHTEAKTEHKYLISPTVLEELSEKSPSSLGHRVSVPFGDDLRLTTYMGDKVPKNGLAV